MFIAKMEKKRLPFGNNWAPNPGFVEVVHQHKCVSIAPVQLFKTPGTLSLPALTAILIIDLAMCQMS